jgi:hypothetical protein
MKRRRVLTVTVGALVLGGVLMVGYGTGVSHAGPPASNPGNPFQAILTKLDEILAAIAGIGGGGGQDGNHTLRRDQALPAAQRFVVLAAFNNDAVLDKNTGLVWEKSPATTTRTWGLATFACINKNVGGQKGWRLPAIAEQASLIDPSVAPPGPTLPPGHPFLNVQSAAYWSASTGADAPTYAWHVGFNVGGVDALSKTSSFHVWCVRGPMQESVY